MFAFAVIVLMRIAEALIDTGLAFSMLSSAMYARLHDAPGIKPFTPPAPDVIIVGGALSEICNYLDAIVKIANVTMHYGLLVVKSLAFPLLIKTCFLRVRRCFNACRDSVSPAVQWRVRNLPLAADRLACCSSRCFHYRVRSVQRCNQALYNRINSHASFQRAVQRAKRRCRPRRVITRLAWLHRALLSPRTRRLLLLLAYCQAIKQSS